MVRSLNFSQSILAESNYDIILLIVGWLVVLSIYAALEVFQSYRDLEAGAYQSLKYKWKGG